MDGDPRETNWHIEWICFFTTVICNGKLIPVSVTSKQTLGSCGGAGLMKAWSLPLMGLSLAGDMVRNQHYWELNGQEFSQPSDVVTSGIPVYRCVRGGAGMQQLAQGPSL